RRGDITNAKIFTDYAPIDSLSLTESLSVRRGHFNPVAAVATQPETAAPAAAVSQTSPLWAWGLVAIVVVGGGGALLLRRRKAEENKENKEK
ncbi:MAG: hypothetical protein LBK98_00730, partial [Peptococcaceae bacterium]|nr:hypothetical protein [Peptococcaceae bacterium]